MPKRKIEESINIVPSEACSGDQANKKRRSKRRDPVVQVRVEIPSGGIVKYEYHKGELFCDRVLHTPFAYPFNYGFITKTLADDGDELDAVILTEYSLYPGTLVNCRILGALLTEDENGSDCKMILVPIDKIDPSFKKIHDLEDLSTAKLDKIEFFFRHYKRLEPKKWVEVKHFISRSRAIDQFQQAKKFYEQTEPESSK